MLVRVAECPLLPQIVKHLENTQNGFEEMSTDTDQVLTSFSSTITSVTALNEDVIKNNAVISLVQMLGHVAIKP